MNRDRQMAKDMENKQAQAREEYAKNKTLMSEYKIKEKATDFVHPNQIQEKEEEWENTEDNNTPEGINFVDESYRMDDNSNYSETALSESDNADDPLIPGIGVESTD